MIYLTGATFYRERETKKKLINFIQQAPRLSFGAECIKFEKAFAKWQGRKNAIFLNSGSSANLALIQGLLNGGWLKKGDKVGFSAITWSTNVMPLIELGLIPVPMDIALETLNTPSAEVERIIKKHGVKAVFITNLLGFSHDLTRVKRICKKNRVLLLEDNCEALGSVENGTKLGNFSIASTFSFFVGHHLSTIEGGMICTDNEKLAEEIRMVRSHGWDRQSLPKTQKRLRQQYNKDPFYDLYTFYDLGYNLRPAEINGFIGNTVLLYANEIVARREKCFQQFAKAVASRKSSYLPLKSSHMDILSAFALPVICKTPDVKKRLIAACKGLIEIRPIVGGNMALQPFFKKYFPNSYKKYPAPNAERVHRLGLYLPIHPDMTEADKKTIVQILASI
jgi:CDP-6-deoxy-D-xylo-4-hexulose-3-dehydrase